MSRVALAIVEGPFKGQKYIYDKPTRVVVGRTEECDIHLFVGSDNFWISRHHCLFEIDPPHVRVRDLGSLNGTYVNGALVGMRASRKNPTDTALIRQPARTLQDGDEIRVGQTVFRVIIRATMQVRTPALAQSSA